MHDIHKDAFMQPAIYSDLQSNDGIMHRVIRNVKVQYLSRACLSSNIS